MSINYRPNILTEHTIKKYRHFWLNNDAINACISLYYKVVNGTNTTSNIANEYNLKVVTLLPQPNDEKKKRILNECLMLLHVTK
jgi:hypothetical protein